MKTSTGSSTGAAAATARPRQARTRQACTPPRTKPCSEEGPPPTPLSARSDDCVTPEGALRVC
eukprot:128333-Prorocentrum_minimum.AAC.2